MNVAVSQVVYVGTAMFHTYPGSLEQTEKKGARKFSGNLKRSIDLVLYNTNIYIYVIIIKIFLCINITA